MQASWRALFFALALVFQTIAGGASAFSAPPAGGGHEHCQQMQGAASAAPDSTREGLPQTHGGCAHCLLCGVSLDAAIEPLAPGFDVVRYAQLIFSAVAAAPDQAIVAHSASARGPPPSTF